MNTGKRAADPPRSVLITGASSGIGEALARRYAAPGVALALSGRDRTRLDAVAGSCRASGARVETRVIDARDREAMAAWICETDRAFDGLELVIANAGISGGSGGQGEDEDQVRMIFDVNLNGVLNTVLPILPVMTARGRGQIALMASLAGFSGWPGAPAYGASKGAIRLYGEALRGAVARAGIRVNVICPGFVESRMTAGNNFPMPFMIGAERAAGIIARGLAQNRGRIAFPWPAYLLAGLIAMLPQRLSCNILKNTPGKSPISKDRF